jgi:hypothetical protein
MWMRHGTTFGRDGQHGTAGPGTVGAFAGPARATPARGQPRAGPA